MASDEMLPEFLRVPSWLKHHPELQRRNIHLVQTLRPGTVYATDWCRPPQYAVKVIDPSKEEADILDSLQRDLACPSSHVVPCEVVRSDKFLAIMPRLVGVEILFYPKNLSSTLDVFDQLLEGITYLHDRGIAHMDLCLPNVMAASEQEAAFDPRLKADKLYIIDFDRSHKLQLKPGVQGAVALPETVCQPPPGITRLDPYSWDVYCAGHLLLLYLEVAATNEPLPRIVDNFVKWLIGNERGCAVACRCRPTAREAREVLTMIRRSIGISECNDGVLSMMHSTDGRHFFSAHASM